MDVQDQDDRQPTSEPASQLAAIASAGRRAHDLDLHQVDLTHADLSGLDGDRLDLRAATLRNVRLRGVRLRDCNGHGVYAEHADWTNATIRACVFDNAHAAHATFEGAQLEDSTAAGADFSRANFRGAHLTETSFARAVMQHVVLDQAQGEGVEFRGADLADSSMVGACFDDADFRGADLRRANLSRGRFRSADFRGALLDGTVFDGAEVSGALFDAGRSPAAPKEESGRAAGEAPVEDALMATLRTLLEQSPALLAAPDALPADLLTRLRSIGDALGAAAAATPAEWTPWADRLVAMVRGDGSTDATAVWNAFVDGPIARAAGDATTTRETLEPLRAAAAALAPATDEPPREWQPILTTLMEMTSGKRSVDLKVLLDELSVAGSAANTPTRG